jgi:glycosyltransferase involved in cell wall biosynthesis
MINILHCSPWPIGGATSYTVHLASVFAKTGVPHRIIRLAKKTERKSREMGSYGVSYVNTSVEDAAKLDGKFLLASAPTDEDMGLACAKLVERSRGAYVFHDPNEFGMYPHWDARKRWGSRCRASVICIREQGRVHIPEGIFIPHPYVRTFTKKTHNDAKTKTAVSVARVSGVKKAHWIIEANQTLPEAARVDLRGEVNRMWWKFTIEKKFPGIQLPENAGFPRVMGAAAEICKPYQLMVDLTIFKEDGGGTQYAMLEAIDAGAVPVMTKEWCSYPGKASDLVIQITDTDGLKRLLKSSRKGVLMGDIDGLRQSNYEYLDSVHSPKAVSRAYVSALDLS